MRHVPVHIARSKPESLAMTPGSHPKRLSSFCTENSVSACFCTKEVLRFSVNFCKNTLLTNSSRPLHHRSQGGAQQLIGPRWFEMWHSHLKRLPGYNCSA